MTGPRQFAEPAPSIDPVVKLRTSAGSPVTATMHVTNNSSEPRIIALTTMGVDADWLPRPTRSRPVQPGETIAAELTLCPSLGTLPARYPLAIAVQALDPVEQQAVSPVAVCEAELLVDAPGRVAVTVQPAAPSAVFGKRVTAVLHNAGGQPEAVDLEVRQPRSIEVSFPPGPVVVPPGASVPVRGRARISRPRFAGRAERHGYTVTARTAGAPRHAEAAVVARPVLGPLGVRATVIVAVIALWAALAVVFIPKLADKVRNQAGGTPKASATSHSTAAPGGGGGSGGSGGGSGGSGGSGSGGSGGGGGGSGGSGGSSGSGGSGPSGVSAVQLNGTVAGPEPSGVSVTLTPTSLVEEQTQPQAQAATEIGFRSDSGPVGKLTEAAAAFAAPAAPRAAVATPQARQVTTGQDGAWSFPKVTAPGYYLVTFSKPGYQTQRYVIDSSAAAAAQPLKVTMQPGEGNLSGHVTGPGGPLGAATVTISDGTNTVTTSSTSKGAVGSWSVSGLSTPGSYLVSISHDGMATESRLVNLPAGGSSTVDLHLPTGVGTLLGTVRGLDEDGQLTGLGGAQVTVTDGKTTRSATTLTTGGALVGSYTLPDLAPGTYTITISDQGFLTQTRRVLLRRGTSQLRVDATLTSATGVVTGTVRFGADVPDPEHDGQFLSGPIAGAGLILSSPQNTYKITSESDGTFRLTGVLPGTYVMSAQYAGMQTQYVTVSVHAGQVTSGVDFALHAISATNTSTITGYVGGSLSPSGTLICVNDDPQSCPVLISFQLVFMGDGSTVDITANGGDPEHLGAGGTGPTGYTLAAMSGGLAPGLYRLTIGATGYLPATINVQVPQNAVATAPAVTLHSANAISGTITALGSLALDGPAPGDQPDGHYRNCVWAVPLADIEAGGTPPTTCPQSGEASYPDPTACSRTGRESPALTQLSATLTDRYPYRVSGLCDGTYLIFVVITNPWYLTPTPPTSQEVSGGHTISFSTHAPRLGHVKLTLSILDPATGRTSTPQAGTLTGSVGCEGTSHGDLAKESSDGVVEVDGVPTGSVDCHASGTDAAGNAVTGTLSGISAPTDQDTPASMTLIQDLGPVVGRVVSTYNGSAHPVDQASVTVTGTTGYDGGTPQTGAVTVKTDSDGCFAITPDGSPTTVSGVDDCASVSADHTGALDLKSGQVTLSVGATSTTPARPAGTFTLASGSVRPVEVGALPASIGTVALSTNPDTGADLSTATITVTSQPAGAGHIDVSADSSGQLHWRDSSLSGADQVVPGTYKITASLTGYQSNTATLSCDPAQPCTVTSGSLALTQLARLTGNVSGLLGSPGDSVESVSGATVQAVSCASLTDCPSASSDDPSVPTNTEGDYAFAGLPPGDYRLVVSASGYHTKTSDSFTLKSGSDNAAENVQLTITLVTLAVHVHLGTSTTDFTHAKVTLTRTDNTDESFTIDKAGSNGAYSFSGLAPATYFYDVAGDGSSAGDSLQETTGILTVPRDPAIDDADNTATFKTTIIASSSRTSVSGQVFGPSGPNPNVPLGGVTVQMWHLVNGSWEPADDVNGNALQTTTASDGTYRFTGVPHDAAYEVKFSKTGYLDATSPQFQVTVGDTLFLGAETLTRVAHNVTVKVSAPDGDNVEALAPTLTSQDFADYTFDSGPAAVSGDQTSWTFNQVPFGCWTVTFTPLPGHFGTLSQTTGSGSCSTGFEVPSTGSQPIDVDFQLAEYRPKVNIALTAIDGDTAPTTVAITAKTSTGDYVYTNAAFPVSSTELPIWASAAWTLTISITVNQVGWPSDAATATVTADSPTATLGVTEIGVSVSVHVTLAGAELTGKESATVSLIAPTGITYTGQQPADAGYQVVTFTGVPAVPGWQATATLDGGNTGTSAPFDVTGSTPTVTVDIPAS